MGIFLEQMQNKEKCQVKDGQANKKQNFTSKALLKIAVIVIFLFLILICPILNGLNTLSDTAVGRWFVIKQGVSDWFAFWGSFSGTLATIFVGFVTLRLTEYIEKDRKENEKLQKKVTIVQNMPNLYCNKAKLFSISKGDILNEHLTRFKNKHNYCIMLEMTPAFPPYFGVSISEIQLGIGDDKESIATLESEDYSFDNHEKFILYINIPPKIEPILEDFYLLNLQTTKATLYKRKNVQMRIRLQCGNTLLPEIVGNVEFDMILKLENLGRDDPGIKLRATNIQFLEIL